MTQRSVNRMLFLKENYNFSAFAKFQKLYWELYVTIAGKSYNNLVKEAILSSFFFNEETKISRSSILLSRCHKARVHIQVSLYPKIIISPSHHPPYLLRYLSLPYTLLILKLWKFISGRMTFHRFKRIATSCTWTLGRHQ